MYRNLFIREFVNFALGNKKKAEYITRLTKKRTDLSKEEIDEIIEIIDGLDIKEKKNRKKDQAAIHWICNGRLILPEDMGKLDEAVDLMNRFGLDYTKFEGPMELINSVPREKRARVVTGSGNPDSYSELELDYKADTELGELKVYFVQDDKEGQMAVREIMNTQRGRDWKGPWCLLYGDGVGGVNSNAFGFWKDTYNKTPKRVAFLNGNIVAFCASEVKNTTKWWDMNDKPWGSKVPLVVERESVVRKVGDFLEIDGGRVAVARFALEDSGIDDINSMEVGYIEKKAYLYDEKGGNIIVDTSCFSKYTDGYFRFKKGNVEFDVGFANEDGTYLRINWVKKGNGDGTYTRIGYDRHGRRISKTVFKEGDGTGDVCLKDTTYYDDGETPEIESVDNSIGTTYTEFYDNGKVRSITYPIYHEKYWVHGFKKFGKDGELEEDGVMVWQKEDDGELDYQELTELEFSRAWNKGKIVSIVGCIDGRMWLMFLDEDGKGKTLERTCVLDHKGLGYEKINLKDENVDAKYKDIADRLIEKYGEKHPMHKLNIDN